MQGQSAIGNRESKITADTVWRWARSLGTHAVLAAGAALMAFPFVWMVMTALKSDSEARGVPALTLFPSEWMWSNFAEAWFTDARQGVRWWETPFAAYFQNTFIAAALVTAGVVLTSLLAGYAFARIDFWGKRVLFGLFLATMMVPFEVILVPDYLIVTQMKRWLVEGWKSLFGLEREGSGVTVAAFAALTVPWMANAFSIFLVTQFFRQIPEDYYDAARLDGCGHWQFLWRIGAPMVAPALVTAGLFSFLGSWNALLWPLVINIKADEAPVIQVALSRLVVAEQQGFNLLMAASTFAILPVVLLYLVAQRRFIEGVAGSGIKG